jgi:aspartate carbamoyltransferase catalytic subunit
MYANVIVCRHSDPNWIHDAQKYSKVPVINAGNGSDEHPTQALLDLYTIKKEVGRLEDLQVLICGDLQYGRTVHSLLHLLKLYKANVFVRPTVYTYDIHEFNLGVEYENLASKITFEQTDTILPKMDAVYMTRLQTERFRKTSDINLERFKYFKMDSEKCNKMKLVSTILHPGPRGDEIAEEVDNNSRAAYHERQVRYGLFIRAAILKMLLR